MSVTLSRIKRRAMACMQLRKASELSTFICDGPFAYKAVKRLSGLSSAVSRHAESDPALVSNAGVRTWRAQTCQIARTNTFEATGVKSAHALVCLSCA